MKRSFFVVSAVCLSVCLFVLCHGCYQLIVGSSQTVTVNQNIDKFDKIDLDSGCSAKITYSDKYSVNITINENLEPYLIVEKKRLRKKLYIGLDPKYTYENLVFEAEITMPSIEAIELEDASEADIDGFDSNKNFDATLRNESILTGNIVAKYVNLQAESNSDITLTGQCTGFSLQATDHCTIDLTDFPATGIYNFLVGAEIQLNKQSTATVTTCKGIAAKLKQSSTLNFYGSIKIVIETINSAAMWLGRSDYCN